MRFFLPALIVALVSVAGSAQADQQMFVVSSDPDGYGVDRCLETGAKCGAAFAAAYCRSQQFVHAASYRRVDRDDVTGSVPSTGTVCRGSACAEYVAILCTR